MINSCVLFFNTHELPFIETHEQHVVTEVVLGNITVEVYKDTL